MRIPILSTTYLLLSCRLLELRAYSLRPVQVRHPPCPLKQLLSPPSPRNTRQVRQIQKEMRSIIPEREFPYISLPHLPLRSTLLPRLD